MAFASETKTGISGQASQTRRENGRPVAGWLTAAMRARHVLLVACQTSEKRSGLVCQPCVSPVERGAESTRDSGYKHDTSSRRIREASHMYFEGSQATDATQGCKLCGLPANLVERSPKAPPRARAPPAHPRFEICTGVPYPAAASEVVR